MLRNILLSAALLPAFVGANEHNGQAEGLDFKVEDQIVVSDEKEESSEVLAVGEDDDSNQIFAWLSPEYEEYMLSSVDDENEHLLANSDDESEDSSKLIAFSEDESSEHLACDESNDETKSVT